MTPAQKRTARRLAMAATAGALTYAGSGVSARAALRGPMLGLAALAVANLGSTALVAAKARNTEARFNNLINNGGSFGGNITVNGNHHATGSVTADGNLVANSNLNATGLASLNGGVQTNGAAVQSSGGAIQSGNGNITSTGGNVNGVNGQFSGNVSDQYATNIGFSVASLPAFIFSATKAAVVTSAGSRGSNSTSNLNVVQTEVADIIHALKNANLMSS